MGVRGVVSLAPGSTWMIAQTSRGDRLKFARLHPGAIEPAREFKGATFAAIPLDFGSDVACRITHGELRCGGVRVTPHHDLRSAAFGDGLGCAIDSGNQLWCWTWPTNHGRVFSKPGAVGFEPRHLAELGAVTDLDIDLQGQHACALSTAGDVWCFGHNDRGQLGDGTTTSRVDPVRVALPAHAVQVTVGATHSCARLADGRVWCWGDGRHGQLGIEIPAFTRPPLTAVAPRT
jgi:alpha-tubulin suppressor-like RCC1 family protein